TLSTASVLERSNACSSTVTTGLAASRSRRMMREPVTTTSASAGSALLSVASAACKAGAPERASATAAATRAAALACHAPTDMFLTIDISFPPKIDEKIPDRFTAEYGLSGLRRLAQKKPLLGRENSLRPAKKGRAGLARQVDTPYSSAPHGERRK